MQGDKPDHARGQIQVIRVFSSQKAETFA